MKKHLLTWLITMMCLGSFFDVRASVAPTAKYVEDFSSPGKVGSQSVAPFPQHYWMRQGTSKTLAANTTYDNSKTSGKRCIGYSAINNGTSSEVLITPGVAGEVKFYVRRNYTSASTAYKSQLELFIMTADEAGKWTRTSLGTADGTSNGITLDGVTAANNITNEKSQGNYQWIPVTLTNVPANTHIGIRMQYLFMDDFTASQVWLEWPAFVKSLSFTPVMSAEGLADYTLIPLDANGNWKFKTKMQLKTTVNAGTPTADDLKFELQLYFNGKTPDHIKVADLDFSKIPASDWNATDFEVIDLDIDITLPPEFYNVTTYFRLVNNSLTPQVKRKSNESQGDDVAWTDTYWSNIKFEGYVPQPQLGYNPNSLSEGMVNISTFSEGHPWPINTDSNEAPIGLVNQAKIAPAKITKVEFSDPAFAMKENLTFPITVEGKGYVWLKPTVVATPPGIYKGKMDVYVEGIDEPYSIELEGAVKPTGRASYKFHNADGSTGAAIPRGWLATGKWAISNLQVNQKTDTWTQSATTYANVQTEIPAPWVLSSPKLRFEENEEVWFDASSNHNGTVEILYSTDRSNWQVLRTLKRPPFTIDETTDLTDCFSGQGGTGFGQEPQFRTFKVTVPQAGEGYIGFRTGDCTSRVDNFVGGQEVAVDFDVAYITSKVPWKAFANASANGTITLRNLADEIAAEAYDIQVLIDGEVVRTLKGSVALPTGVDAAVPVSALFLTEGDHKVSFKMVKGENTVSTPEFTVKVLAENNQEVFQAGPSHNSSKVADDYYSTFINPSDSREVKYEAVYTTQLLQNVKPNGASLENGGALYDAGDPDTGLKNGDKIVSLQWPGWVMEDKSGRDYANIPVKIYLENSSNNNITSEFSDVDFMELVFDGQAMVDFTKTGSDTSVDQSGFNPPVDMTEGVVTVILDKPFEYTGGNLRISVNYPKVYFDERNPVDGAEYCSFNRYNDYNDTYSSSSMQALTSKYASGTADDMKSRMVYSGSYSNSTCEYVPVMFIGKAVEPATISGKVTNIDGGAAVAGAVVTAKNEDGATYTATSDAEGAYSIEIGNTTGTYSVTATAEGYHDFWSADKFNMAEGNKTFNIVMREKAIKISGVVNNEEGPMAGAKVTLKHALSDVSQETVTDAEGKYTFKTELITTDHIIRVEAPYYVAAEKRIGVGDVSVNVDPITLVHVTAKISGTVKGDDGLMDGAKVVIKDVKTNITSETVTDANGAYEFTVKGLDTDYEITVTKQYYQDWTGRQAIGVVDVTVPEIVMTHIIAKISGVVKGSDTQAPLSGVKVTATDVKTNVASETTTDENGAYEFTVKGLDTNYNLTFALAKYDDATAQVAVGVVDATVTDVVMQRKMVNVEATVKGDDGALADAEAVITLDGESVATAKTLADGKIQLTTPREDGKYVLKVTAYGYEPYEQELTLTEDGNVSLGDIVMTHIVVKVSGEVVDENGEAVNGATVTFTPETEGEDPLTVVTGQDGKFEFETKLIDSDWTLTAEAEGYDKAEQVVTVDTEDIDLGKVTLKKTVGIGAIYADGGISVVPGIGCIEISADGANVIVADTMGRVIRVITDLRGSVTVDGLTAGVYLVNRTKVAVK